MSNIIVNNSLKPRAEFKTGLKPQIEYKKLTETTYRILYPRPPEALPEAGAKGGGKFLITLYSINPQLKYVLFTL